jgi:hypothetical protein
VRLRGKAYQVASALARVIKLAVVAVPSWLLAKLSGNAVKQLLGRVAIARHCGYIHITFRAGKLMGQTVPKQAVPTQTAPKQA